MFYTPAAKIARTDVAILDDGFSIADAIALMEKEAKHAIVVSGCSGLRIFSTGTLISLRFGGADVSTPLRELGLPKAETLLSHQVLAEGALLYSRLRTELLCVVDESETLVGAITCSDIIQHMASESHSFTLSLSDLPARNDVIRVSESESLKSAVLKMQTAGHTSVMVFREGQAEGIVSYTDILHVLAKDDAEADWQLPVSHYMTSPVVSISEQAGLDEVLSVFSSRALRRLGVSDAEGRITGLIHQREVIAEIYGYIQEEHYQKALVRTLSENEQRWRAVLEGTGQGVWDWNAQTNKVYFSPVWKSMLGYSEDEIGDTLSEWETRIHPDDLERAYRDVERHLKGETPVYDNTHRVRSKDGRYKWIRDTGKVFSRDADGNPLRVIGSHTDISDEMVAKEQLSQLAEAVPGMLYQFRMNPDGSSCFPFSTQGIQDVYGCSPEEVLSDASFVYQYLHPDDAEDVGKGVTYSAETLTAWEQEYRYLHPVKGTRWLEGRATPRRQSDGAVIWNGYIYDITDRKEQEFALHKARKDADEANRAKSEFLANMSHEIRTPLSGIIGLSQISMEETDPSILHERFSKIHSSGKLLLGILNDILDYSKIESGKLEVERQPFFLDGMFDSLRTLFEHGAEKKQLKLSLSTAADMRATYVGDELRLRQVLTNLIGNAIKFTEHGQISVDACLVSEGDGAHRLSFSIRDTGIGISKEQSQKLFQAFGQADTSIARKHGGSGLGLVISQRLVRAMGGSGIELESELGKGACFSFELTLGLCSDEQENELLMQQQNSVESVERLTGCVLLAEDNLINQEITRTQLEQLGLDVVLAENGQKALDCLSTHQIDLILMDIQMPVMDGYTATQQLRAKGDATPVIALTAAAMVEDQNKALNAGMNGHLSKPIDTQSLFKTLAQWLPCTTRTGVTSGFAESCNAAIPAEQKRPQTDEKVSPDFPLLRPDQGIEMIGGQVALYQTILQEYQRQLETEYLPVLGRISGLTEDSPGSEYEKAHRMVHSVKGVAGNLCMLQLADAAAALDAPLKRSELPVAELFDHFSTLLKQSGLEVGLWLDGQKAAQEVSDSGRRSAAPVAQEQLVRQLEKLADDIKNSRFIDDAELAGIADQLPAVSSGLKDLGVLWQPVQDALDIFDFESAAQALSELRQQIDRM